jgi:hypothetical protein
MSSREHQALQIGLILSAMATVVLAVTTYLYFRKSEEMHRRAVTARAEARDAREMASSHRLEQQLLLHMLGYEKKSEAELATIRRSVSGSKKKEIEKMLANFEQDMATYGAGFPKQHLDYRALASRLMSEIRELNGALADANTREKALLMERDRAKTAETARAAIAEEAMLVAKQELASQKREFDFAETKMVEDKTRLSLLLTQKEKESEQLSTEWSREIEDREKEITNLSNLIDSLKDKFAKTEGTIHERPDGRVVWVDSGAESVWINLGSADGLQRKMTFSVYDQSDTRVGTDRIKGRIEVARVMESHLAEARVLEDQLAYPIMDGDKIYSPSFQKGREIHFALVGFIDMDGDGKSDLEKVERIIETNGGVVDARLSATGAIEGNMTDRTEYLVKGRPPTDKTKELLTSSYTRMIEQATELGVRSISLEALLDRIGYVADSRVVSLTGIGPGGSGTFD